MLEKEQARRHNDYQAVLIDVDQDEDGRHKAAEIAKKIDPEIPKAFDDDGSLTTAYNIQALPLHVILDREGRIAAMFTSTIYQQPEFDRLIDELVRER